MYRAIQILFSALLLIFCQQLWANDNDYILSQSYYLDRTNDLTLAEVQTKTFTPYQELLIGGYSQGAYWVKLDIRAHGQDLVMKIRPAYTNEITLYDPVSSGKARVSGSNHPVDDADVEATNLSFVLTPSSQDRQYFLRIKSVSSYLMYVEMMPLTEFKHAERTENLIYAGYVMLTLILAVWLFMTWLMNRERVIGAFTVQQFAAFLHAFIKVGFARVFLDHYISDVSITALSNLHSVIYPLIALVANKLLLQEYGLRKGYRFVLNTLLVCTLFVIGLFLSGREVTALNVNALLVLVMMGYFWICAIWGMNKALASEASNALQINVLRIFYSFNLVIWLIAVLPLLGIISTGSIALHSLFFYNFTSSLVFFFLLQYRARRLLRDEVARASTLKVEAKQERQRREEQSMLMAMLSHEIKTPLSILKLVVDEKVAGSDLEGHANRAVNNIDFIVNRCLQLGKLDSEAVQITSSQVHLLDFLETLVAYHKAQDRISIQCEDLTVYTDNDILRVVLSNLLDNALKYSPTGSAIELQAETHQINGAQRVQLSVSSQIGPLGKPDPEQVFKKYYRDTSATKIAGSGLGLFLVHELVGILGGTIAYRSEENKITFVVWIPS